MSSAIFSTSFDSYNVEHIIYAGGIQEIPEEMRKNDSTHSFRIITRLGPVYCYYKGIEAARKARGMLDSMLDSKKQHIFRSGSEIIDAESIISYGRVVKLKNNEDGKTHAFTVTLNCANEKCNQIWLTYKTEESAKKARAILWSMIESSNGTLPQYSQDEKTESSVAECSAEIEN